MSDDNKQVDRKNESQIVNEQKNVLSSLEEKSGLSREQVREAIRKVGYSREKIEEYLNMIKNKIHKQSDNR